VAAGTAVARSVDRRSSGLAVLLSGAGLLLGTVPSVGDPALRTGLATVYLVGTVLAIGRATDHVRVATFAAGVLAALLVPWPLLGALGRPAGQAAALVAVCAVALLGLMPRLALVQSGLTRLDDRVVDGGQVARPEVGAALDAAHRTLAVGCVAAAVASAVAGAVLAGTGGPWAPATAVLLGAALLLRLRAFPLTVEIVALVGAVLVIGAALALRWAGGPVPTSLLAAAACLGVTATGLALLANPPNAEVEARARIVADQVEAAAVLALVPAAVGVFGVYGRLIETF
jgi:hypothetical protein